MSTPARSYTPGIGQATADRTINRKIKRACTPYVESIELPRRDDMALDHEVEEWCLSNGKTISEYIVVEGDGETVKINLTVEAETTRETWGDVAYRVALGNVMLAPHSEESYPQFEFDKMHHHLRQASLLMSGRHLQHGDVEQPTRNMEVFTNCLGFSNRINTLEFGPIEIGKIAGRKAHVLTSDGEWRLADVRSYGVQRLYRIAFGSKNGGKLRHEVTATVNHRWLLTNDTVTESLALGDILRPAKSNCERDPQAVVHGVIFGDGTAHKSRSDTYRTGVSYGRTYASIRVCKEDAVREEIHTIFDAAGYHFTTPPHAKGDRIYYLGKYPFAKELPCTVDADYIEGFIYGWWLADGYKKYDYSDTIVISTVDEGAVQWLSDYASFAGYSVVSVRRQERKEGDGSFANGKPLYTVRLRKGVEWVVREIEELTEETVYCVEEPITKSFTLTNGLLTGNCATAAASFLSFYLLLNGSGVGRSYDDDMMLVDWTQQPIVVPVISGSHADVLSGEIDILDERSAKHLYQQGKAIYLEVPDSREGWALAIEAIETHTYAKTFRDTLLILDFSKVRPKGSPIGGMQDRPASGPGPLIRAIQKVNAVRESGMAPWRAAMYVDHYLAECVLVGGARRAARMATKSWRDASVLEFINVKRPIELLGRTPEEIQNIKATSSPQSFLYSSNNSVTVDEEFWELLGDDGDDVFFGADEERCNLWLHANAVFEALCTASYYDGTGEPGLINQDRLTQKNAAMLDGQYVNARFDGRFAESKKYKVAPKTRELMASLQCVASEKGLTQITNPCGEITLYLLGAYCNIADVVPYHAQSDNDAEDAFRTATRALIRVNTMDCLYAREVQRTNRIGVGITGFHEWVWARFGYGWHDIINEEKSKDMWLTLSRFKRAVVDEARTYSVELGMSTPHTDTTMKPAGTTSKLFGLSEGAHLPSMREYLRWVQFRNDDPLVEDYKAKGYPVRKLQTYQGTTIVGFPTSLEICKLGMGDKLVTAAEATPEEQYRYLFLLEKYWIRGVEEDGVTPLSESGNQVSYTLKYDPEVVSFEEFKRTLLEGQSKIRCCSVMPQTKGSAYEYQPEEPVTKAEYDAICQALVQAEKEDVGQEHVGCANGACPVSFNEN